MPSSPFEFVNQRGQLRGPELQRAAREIAAARQLSLPPGSLQTQGGTVIPGQASGGVSLQAVRIYSPASVTTWTAQGGSVVTATPGAGVFNATAIAAGSDGAALPATTINVASTTGFPTAGTLQIVIPGQTRLNTVTYTGTTSTTFTGCTGGTGTIHTNYSVFSLSQYTWSLPAGLLFARVWTVGAGGRGGNASLPNVAGGGVPGMAAAGGGGSGGGCAYKTFAASALQSSMTVLAGMGPPNGFFGYAQGFNTKGRVSQLLNGTAALLSATGGLDGNNGGVTSIGTLINLANNANYDNDGITTISPRAAFVGGTGGAIEDGTTGGVGDLNWQGEAGGYGLIAPDYQTGIAGASTGGTAAASTQGARAYGAGTPGGTGPGVPGGLPGSLGFTLIELIGSYIYPVGPQFNAVGGRGGRAGGPNSGGGPYGYLTSLFDSLGSGTGGSGGVLTWPYALPGATPPPGNGKYGGRGADGMVVIEEYS